MKYRIVRVLNGVVSVGSSDGTFFNVPASDLDFKPQNGMAVQCFKNGDDVIVFMESAPPPSLAPRINQPVLPKNENVSCVAVKQVPPRQNTVPDVEGVFDEEKKLHALLISLIILVVAIAVFVGIYFSSKKNPTDLAKDFGEAATCYIESNSPTCRGQIMKIIHEIDKMSEDDRRLFIKYIKDHGYMYGRYEYLWNNL